jgi:protein-arginine kinase activator protein McsA
MAHKPKEFEVDTVDEFQEMIDNKDFRIAEAVVESIMANLNSKKRFVHLLSIICNEENAVYDITVERKFFAETLEENLAYYIREERYEDCQKIANTIEQLKKQDISNVLSSLTDPKK